MGREPVPGPPSPLATIEARWFFAGPIEDHDDLVAWFRSSRPLPRPEAIGEPRWQGRQGGEPDVYWLIPGAIDLGVKWREGALQFKGRVADLGRTSFAGGHAGRIERWSKWSYSDLDEATHSWFCAESGPARVAVHKMRAQRWFRLDPDGQVVEVGRMAPGVRSLAIELSRLWIDGEPWCSLAFEAGPDDRATRVAFRPALDAVLATLSSRRLDPADGLSYPAFLDRHYHSRARGSGQ